MVTKKKPVKRTVEVTTQELPDEFSDLDPFDRVRAEFGDSVDGGRVKMTILQVPSNGDPAFLMSVDYTEETHGPEWIRDQFGPGKYVLRFFDRNTKQQWSKRFTIARLPGEAVEEGGGDELLKLLREQNREMLQHTLTTKGVAAHAPDPAMVAMVEQQSTLMQMLLGSLLNKPDATGLFISSAEKIFDVVSTMKGETSGDWISQLPKLVKELRPVLESLRPPVPVDSRALAPGAPRPPAPLPVPVPGFTRTGQGNTLAPDGASVSDIQPSQLSGTLDELLGHYALQFLKSAEQHMEPGEIANGVLDSVPALYHPALQDITPERIIALEPGLTAHGEWLARMCEHVKDGGYDPPEEPGA